MRDATKMDWDWSTAGQDLPEDDPRIPEDQGQLRLRRRLYARVRLVHRRLRSLYLGDVIDPDETTITEQPQGDISDPNAKIWPFKVHRANQIYDSVYNYLLQPKTVGEGGYWTEFDWDLAAKLGSEAAGMDYSGEYGFAPTEMYWPLSHMVAPTENALQCTDCHARRPYGLGSARLLRRSTALGRPPRDTLTAHRDREDTTMIDQKEPSL